MPELANIRHEKFAQGVAGGLTGAEACRRVVGIRFGPEHSILHS